MKTNVVMKRPFVGFDVLQRTSDGYFEANDFLNEWSARNKDKGRRRLNEFLNSPKTKSFIETIESEEFSEMRKTDELENQVVIKIKPKTLSNGGRVRGAVWMHPLLFIDFAMYLNPKFKYKVLKFVYDEMILYRKKAADSYKKLSEAVYDLLDRDKFRMQVVMSEIAIAINYVVFNNHYKEIRNDKGTEEMMKELHSVEERLTYLITNGYVKSTDEIIKALRKEYKNKWFGKNLLVENK
jgi:hypothetical protein